jgi:mannose-1-phosphate guanylyltransferase
VFIVTNVAYKELILEQVPDLAEGQILCEPARRNTAPCIAYATSHIRAICLRKAGLTAANQDWSRPEMQVNIVVAASDHLILEEEKFRDTICKAFEFVNQNKAIATLGMQPTRPETGYGYIQYLNVQGDNVQCTKGIYPVKTFTEKPNLEMAKVFLESGDFLWNSGIFIWNLQTISEAFRYLLPEVADRFREGELLMGTEQEEQFIEEMFPKCPNISIDYGIMEKAENVFVIPSSFGWSDLGTWGSLHEQSKKDLYGNVSIGDDINLIESHNCIVHTLQEKKVVIQGLDGYIVAENNDTLLICKLSEEQRIKQFSGNN